jgi:glycosyltransferase involved in cell wall biosynthesis/predicted O-methyltransferase YrrM
MINALSIVVPVLNKESVIIRTLESIEASIAYFYSQDDSRGTIEAEVIVVDEGSTDRTLDLLKNFIADRPRYKLIRHFKSLGAGAARNTGVKMSQGDIVFFCDGDDLFFQPHIDLCYRILNHNPEAVVAGAPTSFVLMREQGACTIELPTIPVAAVRTGVYMNDPLHPVWKRAIENTLPQNLCVRRECHDFIEGFPEEQIYKKIGCEDVSYEIWLAKFFKVFKVEVETVEYIRYPGNNFDRQLKKFQTPPEQYQDTTPPEERQIHAIRQKIEQDRTLYLLDKLAKLEQRDILLPLLNWKPLANDYLNQQRYEEAIVLLEQGLQQEPQEADTVKNLLAAAYNNYGSALRQQKQLDLALSHFQRALAVQPSFVVSDLAKIHYNIATTLRDSSKAMEGLAALQQALALEPNFAEAIAEMPRLKYAIQVQSKGYQFTQDWFSINISVWEQFLRSLVNQPDLRALEIGSWEGRSTCWLLDNVLTHESARITCVDSFAGGAEHQAMGDHYLQTIEERFDFNIAKAGSTDKVRKVVGQSQLVLRSLPNHSFHLAYIDGSHIASDVLEDTILAWRLVKIGGLLIFDDYGFRFGEGIDEKPPKAAIDAFLSLFDKKIKLIHQGYQVIVEKVVE